MKIVSIRLEKVLIFLYISIIVFGLFKSFGDESVTTFSMPVSKKVVVIDAGHGGWDPGVATNGDVYEKDINLQIAEKLQGYLEQGGSTVVITRSDDSALGKGKTSDMNSRKDITNSSKGDIFISIHQNSYPDPKIRGAQAFYFNNSDKSKKLSECVQKQLVEYVDSTNKRTAKSNSNYYVLKQTKIPAIIVESGFLSNEEEKKSLMDGKYQDKVAWGIYKGILDYFESNNG